MASENAWKPEITEIPSIVANNTGGNSFSCSCCHPKKNPNFIGTWYSPDPTATVVVCTLPPPDVSLQIQSLDATANAYICTTETILDIEAAQATETVQPTFATHLDAAKMTAAPSSQPLLGAHAGGANILDQTFASGPSRIFGVLFLMALGSTLWYRRKYLQVLTTSQQPKTTNKPKVS